MAVVNKLRVPLGFDLVPLQLAKPSAGSCSLPALGQSGGTGPRYKHGLGPQVRLLCSRSRLRWAPTGLRTPAGGPVMPEYDRQASLQLPAAEGLPGKPVLQVNAYFRSAALRVCMRSQRSDGAVVLISSTSCVLTLNIRASRCTLRVLHVGNARCSQKQLSDGPGVLVYSINCFSRLNIKASRCFFAHLLRKLHEAAQSLRGLDTACDSTGCIEQQAGLLSQHALLRGGGMKRHQCLAHHVKPRQCRSR